MASLLFVWAVAATLLGALLRFAASDTARAIAEVERARRGAELAAWNDPEHYRHRRALRSANELRPSVSTLDGSYETVVHGSCDGRHRVIIVTERGGPCGP